MAVLYPIRKACPACGKPMLAVPDDVAEGRLRYVCTVCDQDPLHDPTSRKWADGPLRPPAE
jgi:ribosomal protein S27AE